MEVATARAPGAHDASASLVDAKDTRRMSDASDATDPMASFNQEVLEEAGSDYEPAYEEIVEYARWLGVKPHETREFLWIAKEGLGASLPENWKPCRTGDGQVYYFNFATGESDWDHPCDAVFRAKVVEERERRAKGPSGDGPASDASAESSDGRGSSFHSAGEAEQAKHSATGRPDDFASDVSNGDASKTFDRSFASPRPPARKGSPSPRPTGPPVTRGVARTPLGRVDGNAARDGALTLSPRRAKRAGARTLSSSAAAREGGSAEASPRKRATRATRENDENDENALDLSALSRRSNVSNVSNASNVSNVSSRGALPRGRLASLPSLGKDPLAKKPVLGDGSRAKPLGSRSAPAAAPTPSDRLAATPAAAADDVSVSDVSSRSFPSLVLDDELKSELEDIGDVPARVPVTRAIDQSSSALRAALDRALGETREATRARERAEQARLNAETALAVWKEDAEKRRVSAVASAAETFAVEKSALEASAGASRARAREAEDRCEALRTRVSAMEARLAGATGVKEATEAIASIVRVGFAEQKEAWSADRRVWETAARECASRAEKAAESAAEAARLAERVASAGGRRSRVPGTRGVPKPPHSPRSPSATKTDSVDADRTDASMESLTDISASSAETSAPRRASSRSPGRPSSPRAFSDADAGRVRIRGRNLRPQPPSAGSSPATSPRNAEHRERSVFSARGEGKDRKERGNNVFRDEQTRASVSAERRARDARASKPGRAPDRAVVGPVANPASAAAAAAAETCARLVARLERQRAADSAALARGWGACGDAARARARREETEAWLARERASLGAFRRVAALTAS